MPLTAPPPPLQGTPSNPTAGTVWAINGQVMVYTGALWVPIATIVEDEEMAKFNVACKAYNVNSKRLVNHIVSTVEETADEFVTTRVSLSERVYDFSQLTEYLEVFMENLQEEKELTTYDIIGDFRNNDPALIRRGYLQLLILFKQFNCINTTKLEFQLEKAS